MATDFGSIFKMKQLVLENGSFLPPKVLVLQRFYVEILFSLEGFSRHLTPMLGGDRFSMIFLFDFGCEAAGSRERRISASKRLCFIRFLC